jgi:crossover junction endodeoxyribonuclease RuvC
MGDGHDDRIGIGGVFPADDPDGSKAKKELETKLGVGVPCFVGLDMSLTGTGFFKMQKVGGVAVVTMETIKTTPKTCVNDLARLRYIVSEVMRRIPKDVKMVCIEDFFTPSNPFQIGAAIGLAMLGATVRLDLYEAGMPFFVIAPSQVKKFVTGKGTGQKSIVVREVFKRWGYEAKDDNQADACGLAHIAEALCDPNPAVERPKYQQEVVKTVLADRPRYNVPSSILGKAAE